jgi:hypothetical protein
VLFIKLPRTVIHPAHVAYADWASDKLLAVHLACPVVAHGSGGPLGGNGPAGTHHAVIDVEGDAAHRVWAELPAA